MPLTLTKRGTEIDYEAKTVKLAGRRYSVCRNHQEAVKDAATIAPRSWLRWNANSQGATRRWSATPAIAAISRRSATITSRSIPKAGRAGSWPEIIADLDSLTETEMEQDGKRFVFRSAPRPAASLALRAAGVALPPTVRHIDAD